ncbi:MAG: class II aldolase/adducin family protein [Planctomycetes bacterium]|nr:class II aldolase/adducin family protein [Planctomycetota bacterium]
MPSLFFPSRDAAAPAAAPASQEGKAATPAAAGYFAAATGKRLAEKEAREIICDIGRRCWEKNYVAATDGNISALCDDGGIIITPSGVSKARMKPEMMIRVDRRGQPLGGETRTPSTEFRMHVAVYEERPDVAAVVHAHPPTAIAFTLAGLTLCQCVIPEVVVQLGAIPIAPYATPTTEEVPAVIRDFIRTCDAVMLDRHGSLTVDESLWNAYYKLEKLEHTAEILLKARLLGRVRELPADEVNRLLALRPKFGLKNPVIACCTDDHVARRPAPPPPRRAPAPHA